MFHKRDVNSSWLTTGHFGVWVLPQVGIQDSITDLVTNLVCGEAKRLDSAFEGQKKTDIAGFAQY